MDDDPCHPVASPYTFTILSPGQHTIYLKAVDQDGNEDRTPAKFTFAIKKERTYCCDDDDDDRIDHKDLYNRIGDSEDDVQDAVKNSENRIKKKVEGSENDVIYTIEKKLNALKEEVS
jgi:hypothetical protein